MDGHLQASYPDTLVPWEFTKYLICIINNTPHDDDLILKIIDKPSTNEYEYNEDTQGENNEYA